MAVRGLGPSRQHEQQMQRPCGGAVSIVHMYQVPLGLNRGSILPPESGAHGAAYSPDRTFCLCG